MTIKKRALSQEPTWCIISILGFELVNFLLLKETKHTNGVSQDNRLPAYDPPFLQSVSTSAYWKRLRDVVTYRKYTICLQTIETKLKNLAVLDYAAPIRSLGYIIPDLTVCFGKLGEGRRLEGFPVINSLGHFTDNRKIVNQWLLVTYNWWITGKKARYYTYCLAGYRSSDQ